MNQVSKTTALSLSEANIQVAEHMAAVMYFYLSETDATPEEEEEFYNRYFYICLFLGVVSCAMTLYLITHLIKCAL